MVLGSEYVRIDASVLLIYYHVIFRGMLVDVSSPTERRELSSYLYNSVLHTLQHWQNETGERLVDFQAAFFMSWMAADFFNYELSWDCFRRACHIGRHLGLFDVDTQSAQTSNGPGTYGIRPSDYNLTKDQKRYAFWQLLQCDCLFRQLFGKATVIPLGSWNVRFPDLSFETYGAPPRSSIQIHFIVSMRFALITLKFLELPDSQEYVSRDGVMQLVLDLKSVVAEWDLERLFAGATEPVDAQLYADLLFSSHILVMSFMQSARTSRQPGEVLEESLDAARGSIRLLELWSEKPTGKPYNTISLLSSYPVLHVFVLFSSILTTDDVLTAKADLSLTERFESLLHNWSAERSEMGRHLAFVVHECNEISRYIACAKFSSSDLH
ncbi:hypothetical protein BDW60DRAFT_208768 [Aspergillus nidulans var. acristatus]